MAAKPPSLNVRLIPDKYDRNLECEEEISQEMPEDPKPEIWNPREFHPSEVYNPCERCLILVKKKDKKTNEEILVIKGVNTEKVTDLLLEGSSFLYTVEDRRTYVYSEGGYKLYAEPEIQKALYREFSPYCDDTGKPVMNKFVAAEIVHHVQQTTARSVRAFEQKEPLFNVNNGVLDLAAGTLRQHSPKYRMRVQSPVSYLPDMDCPIFLDWADVTVEKKYHDVLQEMFGYSMWHEYAAQRAFMLYGRPRTGKGTLLRILQSMLVPIHRKFTRFSIGRTILSS